MGDMAEGWDSFDERFRVKRAQNKANSTEILKGLNISFQSKNSGAHLIVEHNGKTIDFYPSTGLWWDRTNRKQRRGIKPLLRYLGIQRKKETK